MLVVAAVALGLTQQTHRSVILFVVAQTVSTLHREQLAALLSPIVVVVAVVVDILENLELLEVPAVQVLPLLKFLHHRINLLFFLTQQPG